eukprot:2508071-Amphidinium_carterae.2
MDVFAMLSGGAWNADRSAGLANLDQEVAAGGTDERTWRMAYERGTKWRWPGQESKSLSNAMQHRREEYVSMTRVLELGEPIGLFTSSSRQSNKHWWFRDLAIVASDFGIGWAFVRSGSKS